MKTYLGIELGSTRIKAVAVDEHYIPVSWGEYGWKSHFFNGVWTYELDEAFAGVKAALKGIENRQMIACVGISGMMHGYLAFDKDWNLLTPFRTWQNTITSEAAETLSESFCFNVPQRWSIAHLYQAVLNHEDHITKVAHITTLAGYIHYVLTGVNAVGIGEASGIFPIDNKNLSYDRTMMEKFQSLIEKEGLPWTLAEVLPNVLVAGEAAGVLTEEGAEMLDNMLPVGTLFAPPEGDAGTGMVATNAIAARTGNVSAGTSIFSMVVLEEPLKNVHPEIDVVTTPAGLPVAMVHCNNCTNDSNEWFSALGEVAALFSSAPSTGELYTKLYQKSLEGDADCGGVLVCNYMAGEGITHFDEGRPLVLRTLGARFTLANFLRATLYSTMATLKFGMDILAQEHVRIDSLTGHGGLFKTEGVGQRYMAAACNTPITVMKMAGEGGPYGMAVLAAFVSVGDGKTLEAFLGDDVFCEVDCSVLSPQKDDVEGFSSYVERYKQLLSVERTAIEVL